MTSGWSIAAWSASTSFASSTSAGRFVVTGHTLDPRVWCHTQPQARTRTPPLTFVLTTPIGPPHATHRMSAESG
jgi:hypothetical protein